jgi:hypothetical protein
MKRTYVMVDGEFVERKRDASGRHHYIMPDIAPYKSMIDGRMITSRSQHRLHLKAHGCVEVGNEDPTKFVSKQKPKNCALMATKSTNGHAHWRPRMALPTPTKSTLARTFN